jgi:hypothetical protein
MKAWELASEQDYRAQRMLAHGLLADVPLHDVWRLVLPASGRPGTMTEVRRVAQSIDRGGLGLAVPALFTIRRLAGKLLSWNEGAQGPWTSSLPGGLPSELAERSLVPAGTPDGPFRVTYVLDDEAMSETRNATVEAFLAGAIRPHPQGFELLFAIHVKPTGLLTRPYLAAIAPFRRFLVYPALLGSFHRQWAAAR